MDDTFCWIYGMYEVALRILVVFLAFPVLMFGWKNENPKRPVEVWMLDCSKQIIGNIVLFFLPTFDMLSEQNTKVNSWVILLMVIVTDTIFVTIFSYIFLKVIQNWFASTPSLRFFSGIYNQQQLLGSYAYQLIIWLIVIIVSKMLFIGVTIVFVKPMIFIFYFMLYLFKWNQTFEELMILVILPLVSNIITFHIQDNFLKDPWGIFMLNSIFKDIRYKEHSSGLKEPLLVDPRFELPKLVRNYTKQSPPSRFKDNKRLLRNSEYDNMSMSSRRSHVYKSPPKSKFYLDKKHGAEKINDGICKHLTNPKYCIYTIRYLLCEQSLNFRVTMHNVSYSIKRK